MLASNRSLPHHANSRSSHDNRVDDFLNDKLQTIEDLKNIDKLLEDVLKQQNLLATQLQEARHARDLAVSKSVAFEKQLSARGQRFQKQKTDIDRRLQIISQSETSDDALIKLDSTISRLHELEVAQGYFNTLKEAENLSEQTQAHLGYSDHQKTLQPCLLLQNLVKELERAQPAAEGAAPHLVLHVKKLSQAVWIQVENSYGNIFKKTLKKMGWPRKDITIDEHLVEEWQNGIEILLDIQQSELESKISSEGSLEGDSPVLLPLKIMMKPLELRFEYHFEGRQPTNRLDKPEYFLSHVADVLNTYDQFFRTYLQPVLRDHFRNTNFALIPAFIDSTSAFITSALPMVSRKLLKVLPAVANQPELLSHLIHELMSFDTSLREEWLYDGGRGDDGWKGLSWDVLVKHSWFSRWLTVEKDFALRRYEDILEAPESFEIDRDSDSSTTSKPTFAAIRVNDLLEAVTEDYRPLMSFHQRIQFLIDIQMAIFDLFYNRLNDALIAFQQHTSAVGRIQGASRETQAELLGIGGLERLCRVYGSAEYLEGKMRDWSDDVFFVELWDELQSRVRGSTSGKTIAGEMNAAQLAERTSNELASDDDSGSLFDETTATYRRLRIRAEDAIQNKLIFGVRETLRPYRKVGSWNVAHNSSFASLTPTAALDGALAYLTENLSFLSKVLALASFRRIGRQLTLAIQNFIWDKVIIREVFSTVGAAQLRKDVETIITIGDRYLGTGQTQRGLGRLQEALLLLELPDERTGQRDDDLDDLGDGVRVSLWEVERGIFENNESARQTLEELGVFELNASDARDVLRRRTELQD